MTILFFMTVWKWKGKQLMVSYVNTEMCFLCTDCSWGGEFFELIVYEYLQKCVFDVLLPRALLEEVNVAVDGHVGQLFLLHRGEVRGAIPQGLLQV